VSSPHRAGPGGQRVRTDGRTVPANLGKLVCDALFGAYVDLEGPHRLVQTGQLAARRGQPAARGGWGPTPLPTKTHGEKSTALTSL
jgi:hypothetical protein